MALDKPDFESITEADLLDLVEASVPEGVRLEYKRDAYGATDADKREFLKDVSALANSLGGHLLIGIDANANGAVAAPGLAGVQPDQEILRLEQLARSGLEPPVIGIQMRAVRMANANHVLVLRVPRSWNVPHRVSAQNSNRYWLRNSAGAHEASMDELRTLFAQTASAINRVRDFRDSRIATVCADRSARPLVANGRFFLHILPVTSGSLQIDLRAAYQERQAFVPIGVDVVHTRFNLLGLINERTGEDNHGYTQIFRDGSLEATKAGIITNHDGQDSIAGGLLERQFFNSLPRYLDGLQRIGVPPPLVVSVVLEGVNGVCYAVGRPEDDPDFPLPQDLVVLPECVITEFGDAASYQRSVRPAFDALWNAIGRAEAGYFDEEGAWIGPAR